ncbi:CPBP family intramembrane glutamic endopeptidase [Streptomyces sp. NPDC048508]|uniref:CPBP family intramembrane glutamic endopeptidase n=1 Tax=Streptomyces sp. NPDC048508 TaxID=3365561 RepID=UPI00371FE0B3
MTNPLCAERLPYHRLALASARHRWWRPLAGTLFIAGGWLLALILLDSAASGWGTHQGYPKDHDGSVEFGPLTGTALDLLYIAIDIPLVLLAVRWIGRRPVGTASSVAGRLRGRWLGLCLLVALPVLAAVDAATLLLPVNDTPAPGWAGWHVFLPALAMLLVLVPLQAAAEEYVFRGWLTQAIGGFFRSPWIAVVPQAVLFAAAHGLGTPWGFADLVVFGLAAGWMTVRTGGLEAAIGLHVINNLIAFGLGAAVVDGLKTDETAADAPWQWVAVDTVAIAAYVAVVLWFAARRRHLLARTAAAPAPLSTTRLAPLPPRQAPAPAPAGPSPHAAPVLSASASHSRSH